MKRGIVNMSFNVGVHVCDLRLSKKIYIAPEANIAFDVSRDPTLLSSEDEMSYGVKIDSIKKNNTSRVRSCPHCSSVHFSLLVCTAPLCATLTCDGCGKSLEVNGGKLSEVSMSELLILWREALEDSLS